MYCHMNILQNGKTVLKQVIIVIYIGGENCYGKGYLKAGKYQAPITQNYVEFGFPNSVSPNSK